MRKSAALVATGIAMACVAGTATPAAACGSVLDPCSTSVSFQALSGALTISISTATPATVQTTVGSNGSVVTIPLGSTTVTDTRSPVASWTMKATTTNFSTALLATVDKTAAAFSVSAAPTAPSGSVLPAWSTSPSTTPQAVDANGSRVLMTTTAGASNTGATFTPVLTVNVPAGTTAGTYTGTVTQSVA